MIKTVKSIMILLFALTCTSLYSQDDSLRNTSISYNGYTVNISSNQNRFFTGRLEVLENGVPQFVMDSVFSDYVEHNIIDLDGDGKEELLLSVSEGASPYVFGSMYIFDATGGAKPRYFITNASLDTTDKSKPVINTFVRMSPSAMGLSYRWQMSYANGRLQYDTSGKNKLYLYGPDYEEIKSSINEIWPSKVDCEDYTYSVFFDYVFINSKIAGNLAEAENFFNTEYKCPDKVSSLIRYKNTASETLSWIKDEKNYLYSEY